MTAGFGAWAPGLRCLRPPTRLGPLDGVRLAVKDLIDVEGALTGGGNPDWAAGRVPATQDAPAVAALRAAGAEVVGKTVTDELAFSLEGANAFHGTPRNPRAMQRLPGGSSSGSAVAVAAGLADVALGTDTGGSVRVPASFCGVWAMRPTHGRIPLTGVLPFAPSFDTVGWFARNADLLARTGEVLLAGGPVAGRPPLRLRIATDAVDLCDLHCGALLRAAALQRGIEGTVQAFDAPWETWCEAYTVLQGLEIQATLGDWIRTTRPRFGPMIAPRFGAALALDPKLGPRWDTWRAASTARLRAALGPDEAWLVPAAPCVALPLDADGEDLARFYLRALAIGSLAGHAGLPQVVMPLAQAHGLPLGLSLISGPGNDERLLALAQDWEVKASANARPSAA